MKENLKKVKNMDMENIVGVMEKNMKVFGKMINEKDMEHFIIQMEINMKEILKIVRKMDLVFL